MPSASLHGVHHIWDLVYHDVISTTKVPRQGPRAGRPNLALMLQAATGKQKHKAGREEDPARMSSGSQVIRATQVFTKQGKSKQVSLLREIGAGLTLGLAFGLVWKVRPCS